MGRDKRPPQGSFGSTKEKGPMSAWPWSLCSVDLTTWTTSLCPTFSLSRTPSFPTSTRSPSPSFPWGALAGRFSCVLQEFKKSLPSSAWLSPSPFRFRSSRSEPARSEAECAGSPGAHPPARSSLNPARVEERGEKRETERARESSRAKAPLPA